MLLLVAAADQDRFLVSWQAMAFFTRFYVVDITATLFGEWAVLREWGRRGSPGALRLDSYRRRGEAQSAEQRTIKRRCSTVTRGCDN